MPDNPAWRNTLFKYPILLFSGLLLTSLALLALLFVHVDAREQGRFAYYSSQQMRSTLDQQLLGLTRITRDYAVWDEMASRLVGHQYNLGWIRTNLTESLYRNLEVTDVLILTADLHPAYFLLDGVEVPLEDLSGWNAAVYALMTEVNGRAPIPASLSGYIVHDGGFMMVTIERIRPEHLTAHNANAPAAGWIIFARRLHTAWRENIGEQLLVNTLEFAQKKPEVVPFLPLPLIAEAGQINSHSVGWLSWQVDRRRMGTAQWITVPLMVGLSGLFLLILLLARTLLDMHKEQLIAQQRMLRHSEILRQLAHRPFTHYGDELHCLQEVATAVGATLHQERVSIWRQEGEAWTCLVQNGEPESRHPLLDSKTSSAFLMALQDKKTLVFPRAALAPPLASWLPYLQSHGLESVLAVAILLRGRIGGLLLIESNLPRSWSADQINFANSIVELIATTFEAAERSRAEAALHRRQYFDALTGLPNQEKLARDIGQCLSQPDTSIAFMLINLSGLIRINEEFGRSGGDYVLQVLAQRLESLGRQQVVARISGNRFALALLNHKAERVQEELEKMFYQLQVPVRFGMRPVTIQIACGVSLAPQDADSFEDLLRHAEFAVETARSKHHTPIEYYAPEVNAIAHERYLLAETLPLALARREFVLHYQPVIELATGQIVGAEALIRWLHPEKGLIAPGVFIELAEETGIIEALGRFIVEEACTQLARWQKLVATPLRVAVNLSPAQLREPGFERLISDELSRLSLPCNVLELEITESQSVDTFLHAAKTIAALHAMGVGIALDDFGTGYSSLAYLRDMTISKLKIDRSFVEKLPDAERDCDLARMIISLGAALKLPVVAEGVETVEQARFLRDNGCQYVQGFYYSRPLPPDEFARLLQIWKAPAL